MLFVWAFIYIACVLGSEFKMFLGAVSILAAIFLVCYGVGYVWNGWVLVFLEGSWVRSLVK